MLDTPSLPPAPRKARRARCNWRGSPPPPASIPNCDATGRVLRERQAEAQAQVAVDSEAARYRLEAPGAGRLRDRDPDLRQGDWLGRRELLGRVVSAGPLQVVAYVPEDALPRLRADGALHRRWRRRTGPGSARAQIDQDATRVLQEAVLSARMRASQTCSTRNGRCTG